MRFHFTNYPRYVPPEAYDAAIASVTARVSKESGVVSIFQVGSILHPGISDIDMLVVLSDNAIFRYNPLRGISDTERYLFVHPLIGVSQTDFMEAQQFSFYRNWRLLCGEPLIRGDVKFSQDESDCLRIQVALEYMLSNYIHLTVLRMHRIVNIRALLLNMKAMVYDLKLLNISSGPLYELLETLLSWRDQWFETQPQDKELAEWIEACYEQLGSFLETTLKKHRLYLPPWGNLEVTKNVKLAPAESFCFKRHGLALPASLAFLGKKYMKLQRRFRKVLIYLPMQRDAIPPILARKFELEYRMVRFNLDKPFLSLRSTLNFLRKIHSSPTGQLRERGDRFSAANH